MPEVAKELYFMIKNDKSCFSLDKKAKDNLRLILRSEHLKVSIKKQKYKAAIKDAIK